MAVALVAARCWPSASSPPRVSYVSGILATRALGARLASFVALLEVLFSVVFAWLLLGQLPSEIQLLGGVLLLAGVIVVRAGEPDQR